jgi:drug/metabolite transporter (DMT)-like permease
LSNISTRARVILAFAAIYVIWGSTYLAIRIGIESLPPLIMGGVRHLSAGLILYAALKLRGMPTPPRVHWRSAAIVGALLLMGGNGGVILAESLVPSGIAALIIATVPLWMALLGWLRGGARPGGGTAIGLALGLIGIVLLVNPGQTSGDGAINPIGAVILLGAALCWSTGSLYSRSAPQPSNPLMSTAMQMLAGGALMLIIAFITGEGAQLHLDQVTARSVLATLYLIVFGSLIAFSAYVWLLKVSTPAHVSTYAFVNPIVAVLLGAVFANEELTARMLIAAAIIIAGVVLITTHRPKAEPIAETEPAA